MKVSSTRIRALERAEVDGAVTLASLRRAAEAMNCTLIYALVPNRPLDELVRERARAVATERLAGVDHTMRLENQAVEGDALAQERDRLAAELADHPRRLWDMP